MDEYFPKPPLDCKNIKIKVDLSNYATKTDIKDIIHVDTSNFALKTNYNTKITELENKISDTSGLVKKTDYNTKITGLENKISDISNLATKAALTTVRECQ